MISAYSTYNISFFHALQSNPPGVIFCSRFTVSIILKPEKEDTPTGVDNINTKANQPIKFLYQDKIYILRNGMIYDTTGKQVITINK